MFFQWEDAFSWRPIQTSYPCSVFSPSVLSWTFMFKMLTEACRVWDKIVRYLQIARSENGAIVLTRAWTVHNTKMPKLLLYPLNSQEALMLKLSHVKTLFHVTTYLTIRYVVYGLRFLTSLVNWLSKTLIWLLMAVCLLDVYSAYLLKCNPYQSQST